MFLLFVMTAAIACSKALPEEGSPQAKLYKERCGACHRPYHPGTMTVAMWKYQVDRAERSMSLEGNVLSDGDREAILDYLARHASNHETR